MSNQPSQAGGNTQANASARSAATHPRMNPQPGQNVLFHTLARMLPLHEWQSQVYRFAEKYPPGLEDGFSPIWECATCTLAGRQTTQLRINFQREFHLLAVTAKSSAAGGFRAQIYDQIAQRRLADRGVNFANYFGTGANPMFLREPYLFQSTKQDGMDGQALVVIQNQDTGNNTIQVVLYGQARRFNFPS